MSDSEDYNSESDEDYVPSDGEAVSEEEHSGDEEDLSLLKEDDPDTGQGQRSNKKLKKSKKAIGSRNRKGGIKLDGEEVNNGAEENEEEKTRKKELEEQIAKETEMKKEEQEKKRTNDLWSSFLSDVGSRPKPKQVTTTTGEQSLASLSKPINVSSKPDTVTCTPDKSTEKITVTKMFDFAGEEVRITKEVDVKSKEGQMELKKQNDSNTSTPTQSESPVCSSLSGGIKRPAAGGGLGSVLNKINKKPKISTLDKSKLDWEAFKEKEGISDELSLHNRGKESYIERQNFLSRTDYRQFEIEKNLRLSSSKR